MREGSHAASMREGSHEGGQLQVRASLLVATTCLRPLAEVATLSKTVRCSSGAFTSFWIPRRRKSKWPLMISNNRIAEINAA